MKKPGCNKCAETTVQGKAYIDKETGLIAERTDYMFDGIFLKKITCDRNLKIDSVTEEDVKRPDLTGYEILQYRWMVIIVTA